MFVDSFSPMVMKNKSVNFLMKSVEKPQHFPSLSSFIFNVLKRLYNFPRALIFFLIYKHNDLPGGGAVRAKGGRHQGVAGGGKARRFGGGERGRTDGGGGGGGGTVEKSRQIDADGVRGGTAGRGGDVAGHGDGAKGQGRVSGNRASRSYLETSKSNTSSPPRGYKPT